MSSLSALVHQLESYAQEELDVQLRTLALLREQEASLFHADLEGIRANFERVDQQLSGCAARHTRRQELLRRLGTHFGVAPSSLTLTSLCARLGRDGERLGRLAAELREAAQNVARSTRRLSALARLHARLNDEILGAVLATRGVEPKNLESSGALFDAQV